MGNIIIRICVVFLIFFFQKTEAFLPAKCSGNSVITCFNQSYINPQSFPTSMTELQISSSTITNLQNGLLQTLAQRCPDLKIFKIMSSVIKNMHSCSFASVSNFSQIRFQDSSVETIVQNAFSDLRSVQKIEFINVKIEEISKIAFHQIRGIEKFTMDKLTVKTIRYASFAELEDVELLQLTNSYIDVMEQQPIVNEQSISKIEFRGNTVNSTLCGMDSLFKSNFVFDNNNLTCNSKMTSVLAALPPSANNRCLWNVIEECPPLKDTNVLKHSYDCQAVIPDEGIPPLSENEIYNIEPGSKNNNHAQMSMYADRYFLLTIYMSLALSVFFCHM